MGVSIDSSAATIKLACGNVVIVDSDDAHLVAAKKWRFRNPGSTPHQSAYVVATDGQKQVFLHRVIVGAAPGTIIDHINGDRLDNRKSNLRQASHTENMRNRKKHADGRHSVFKGVSRFSNGKFRALIRDGSKQIYLGSFETEVSAAFAYDVASLQIHGDFGRRNFLPLC